MVHPFAHVDAGERLPLVLVGDAVAGRYFVPHPIFFILVLVFYWIIQANKISGLERHCSLLTLLAIHTYS